MLFRFYVSATYILSEETRVTAALRYTDETKRYSVRFLSAPDTVLLLADGRPAARTIRTRFTDLSPRLVLDRRIGGALLYASVAKGFRSGSFDGRARNIEFALTRQDVIAPETVWSWEAGAKADLLRGRLRVNVAYFLNNYTDIAFSAARANSTPPEIFRQNVGDARLHGLEVEWTATPLAGVDLGGWISTLSDRFTRLRSVIGCTGVVERDLDLRFTPAFRYQVRAGLTPPVGAARVRVGGDYGDASSYNIALCNEPQHRVSDAGALKLQLGVEVGDWGATLSATNLTDNRYNSGSVSTVGYPVAPREIVLRVRRRI